MPTPPLDPELAREAYEAWRQYGTKAEAARALGINRRTLSSRIDRAIEGGIHLPAGVRDSIERGGLDYGVARGGHRRVYDEETGKQIDTVRYSIPQEDMSQAYLERIVDAFAEIPAAPPIVKSERSAEGKIALFPQTDVHLGADISADHGGKEYNPDIALERMRDGFSQAHAAIPPCETAIVLDNGDLTHANDNRDVTYKSQHRLKVRGSHYKNLSLCVAAKAWQIDMALQRSDRVVYRSNAGNHDPNTPDTLNLALKARYANEPRVSIDDTERRTWVFQRGLVFIASHHGDGLKPQALASNLMPNFPDQFGVSRFWYLLTGHYHEEASAVFGGVRWFQLPSICSLDQNSSDLGYSDGAAQRAMMFCERSGLKSDITVRF